MLDAMSAMRRLTPSPAPSTRAGSESRSSSNSSVQKVSGVARSPSGYAGFRGGVDYAQEPEARTNYLKESYPIIELSPFLAKVKRAFATALSSVFSFFDEVFCCGLFAESEERYGVID